MSPRPSSPDFKDRKWKERFHANMFDAVALGMMVN
jgi:hypothetical protein